MNEDLILILGELNRKDWSGPWSTSDSESDEISTSEPPIAAEPPSGPRSTSDDISSPEPPVVAGDPSSGPWSSPDETATVEPPIAADPPSNPGPGAPGPAKRRRSPNAFILYRSHIIANKLYPATLTDQKDISRHVADKWRDAPPAERFRFFEMAMVEKQRLEANMPQSGPSKRKTSNKTRDTNQNSRQRRTEAP